MSGFDPSLWTRVAIVLAVGLSVLRLLLWQRSAPAQVRSPLWRVILLIGLQLAAGALLHLVLFPPSVATRTGTLVVTTGGASGPVLRQPGDVRVALPEAGEVAGAQRMPDLATALRRFPGAARVRVEGAGLVPRDQAPLGVPLAFEPPPPPRGLVGLAFPLPAAPGAGFAVGGQIGSLTAGVVELVDPANAISDRVRVTAGQRFVLRGTTRTPGLALFALRLRDGGGRVVEEVAVPLETLTQSPPRVRVLAGAPSAETKFLRQWAEDSGIEIAVEVEVGAGVRLGDAQLPLTRASLAEVDLVVIDDRRWEALGDGGRAALASAAADGMGLLLRPSGPLSAETRRSWATLGLPLSGGDGTRPLRLAPGARAAREGAAVEPEVLPELARLDLAPQGPQAISLARDAQGAPIASWRARGRGRIGVWTVTDSYALVLTGRPDRYGELWSTLFSALARANDSDRVRVEGLPRAGERVTLCGIAGAAGVLATGSAERRLQVDPASGERACAAYWPEAAGWAVVRDGQGRETPFYVHPADAAPSLRAAANRDATLALAGGAAPAREAARVQRAPGSPWPWFAALIAILTGLWWLERRPRASATAAQGSGRATSG
jgi:hypothetical protein